jgi:hypothetical protein
VSFFKTQNDSSMPSHRVAVSQHTYEAPALEQSLRAA